MRIEIVSDGIVRWASPDFTAAGGKHAVYHRGALHLPPRPIWNVHMEVLQEECKELLVNYYFIAPGRYASLQSFEGSLLICRQSPEKKKGNVSPAARFSSADKCIECLAGLPVTVTGATL